MRAERRALSPFAAPVNQKTRSGPQGRRTENRGDQIMTRNNKVTAVLTVAIATLTLGIAVAAIAGGPPGGTIYAHDVPYRTVATPTNLPDSGMFDTIYALGDGLAAVSESAPGDQDYNGGRWEVRPVTFVSIPPTQFTNAEQVLAAAAAGDIEIGDVVLRFECPLIPMH